MAAGKRYRMDLNDQAFAIAAGLIRQAAALGCLVHETAGVQVLDCGVECSGSEAAGLGMARAAVGGAGEVTLVTPGSTASAWAECQWSSVAITSCAPVAACLAAQYAGWRIASEGFFAMASGPMRAAIGREALFDTIGLRERPAVAVGILEAATLPPADVCHDLAAAAEVTPENLILLVARTASPAGGLQVVARSLETALHKLHDLGFDLERIRAGSGIAPLPPVAPNDLAAIGRTNDAILYGGSVTLEVVGDDASLSIIGPLAVSSGSSAFGRPFLAIFEAAGRDFYRIDPALFAPARLELVNLDTGSRHRFGTHRPDLVAESFAQT
jgi:methenyltetrahydromethanopterin cyclohydrolase